MVRPDFGFGTNTFQGLKPRDAREFFGTAEAVP